MKILYITPYSLFPQDHHGARRCLDEIVCFLNLNYEIYLVIPSIWKENLESYIDLNKKYKLLHIYPANILNIGKDSPQLQFFNRFFGFYPIGNFILNLNYKNIQLISHLIHEIKFDIVIYVYFWVLPLLSILKKFGNSKFKTLYIAQNIESNYLSDLYPNVNNFAFTLFKKLFYIYETKCWKFADYIVVLSDKEKRIIETVKGDNTTYCIYPSLDYFSFQNKTTDRSAIRSYLSIPEDAKLIVFHGINVGHNRIARSLIINYISKEFDEKSYFFLIFGPKNLKEQRLLKIRNLRILGAVEYELLIDLIKSSDLAIVPLVSGAGFKGKILDYLAGGIPVVTTYKGAEGTGLINNIHILISNLVDEQFILNMKRIFTDVELSKRLVENSNKYLEKMTKERFENEYNSLINEILDNKNQ